MTEEQASFSGYAVVDVMGKQRYVGFVRTETYGQATLFRVDVPALSEREYVLDSPEYADNGQWVPKGSKVKRPAAPGYTKLIGAASIYMLSPCSEEAAMKAVEAMQRSPLKLIELPPDMKALPEPELDEDEEEEDGEFAEVRSDLPEESDRG